MEEKRKDNDALIFIILTLGFIILVLIFAKIYVYSKLIFGISLLCYITVTILTLLLPIIHYHKK